ncbi:MAG TPA: KUP/HAK/KT family potassium transporter [Baekduia sp.]|nr:KUP/HAK/KT family potassium transporter [Baekduia sp.]
MTASPRRGGALTLGALGVVFGDIGTSPLYAMQTIFSGRGAHTVPVSHEAVYGVVSLVFWTVMVVVTVTYVALIMRADNDGEGGIMSLIALLQRSASGGARTGAIAALSALGIFGASLFLGDSTITPAISVLSAVEGLRVVSPGLESAVIPITAAILIGLFAIQRLGTAVVGRLFGPVMAVWFAVIALWGLRELVRGPGILRALSPTYAVSFFAGHPGTAFLSLAAVVLTVTGAEALYADMGHFGRGPIRRAWALLVLPALLLTYLGQGALILRDPHAVANPFFLMVAGWARIPMILLATVATIIASQAVISGAFSVTRQAIQLGYLPRLRIVQTSPEEIGQIYVPWVNWALLAAVLTLVFAFGSSAKLASAYGVAVTGTIGITILLFFAVARMRFGWPAWAAVGGAVLLGAVDLAFFAANLPKIFHGGWLPVLVALLAYTVLMSWRDGRRIVTARRTAAEGPLGDFVAQLHDPADRTRRVPGTAIFLNRSAETTPLAMRATVEHMGTLHEQAVIVTIETVPRPHVPPGQRLVVSDLGYHDDGLWHVTARFGFQDVPRVTEVLRSALGDGLDVSLDLARASYFLSKVELVLTDEPDMARWRKRLFVATSHLTADPVDWFGLPRDRAVLMGSMIEL